MSADRAGSLRGARVLVTRAAEDAAALEGQIRARGGEPVAFPCIAFAAPRDEGPLDAALRELAFALPPQWVALSSPQAVRRLWERLEALGLPPSEALRRASLAAVGAGTAEALAARGLKAALVPARGAGARVLAEELSPRVRGQRVLLPRAEEGNPELAQALAAAGAEVRAVALYRTVAAAAPDPAGLAALRRGLVHGILFASGSAASGFASLLGAEAPALAAAAKVACMGARCAAAARAAGLPVDAVAGGGLPELLDALSASLP